VQKTKRRKNKMIKNRKRRSLFSVILFSLLMISCVCTSTISPVYAATDTLEPKGLTIINDVVGLDITKYDVTTKEYPHYNASSYRSVVPQETIDYDLTCEGGKVRILCTFANRDLQILHVLENEGEPSLTKAVSNTSIVDSAKAFLGNYQKYTANSFYGELALTLDNVDVNENITRRIGNTQLEVTSYNGYTSIKWYYTFDGAVAPYSKFVSLVFKEDFLAGFVDNWQFYNIGTTNITLSREEAIMIALETAKTHSYSLKLDADALETQNFNESNIRWTSLIFDDSLDADKTRNEDLLTLYPVWRVGIALDKWYGHLYGIIIDIWADNGEVRYVQEAWSTLPPPEVTPQADITTAEDDVKQSSISGGNNLNATMLILLPTLFVAITGIASFWVHSKKNSKSSNLLKPRSLKIGRILFCFLMLSVIVPAPIATVSAATNTAVIWGSESTGAGPPDNNWRKSEQEILRQRYIASLIKDYFETGGYTAHNHQGILNPGSSKTQILSDIETYSDASSRVAFVDFDHGVGNSKDGIFGPEFHFMFEDNVGTMGTGDPWLNGVYDMDIWYRAEDRKTTFAFISTCMSSRLTHPATGEPWQGYGYYGACGLPYAFTFRYVENKSSTPGFTIFSHMSDDAYFDPDDGSQVYIGFPYGSPSLTQRIPHPYGNDYYWEWVDEFFKQALYYDISVNQALDHACFELWGMWFANQYVPLRDFTAHWDGMQDQEHCNMTVYGNGKIKLENFADNFDDGNYNGWTVSQGSWTVSSGKLRAQQGFSLIRTGQQFTTDRHVRTKVRTLTAGPDSWDVAWVIAKYLSSSYQIYSLLHKNGDVELAVVYNGQKLTWSTSTNFSPYDWNTIDIDIVGNKAYVSVNDISYLEITHNWFDNFSGYTALSTFTSSTAEFDDITVVNEGAW
jgi:hypothetical protein